MKEGNIMAYNDYLAGRVRRILHQKHVEWTESASFGQLSFKVDNQFIFAVKGDQLELRLSPEAVHIALDRREHTPVDPRSRRMKGFVIVDPAEFDIPNELEMWIDFVLIDNLDYYMEPSPAAPTSASVNSHERCHC